MIVFGESLSKIGRKNISLFMANNEDLEKRIENLEKEVKHLKAVLQYQMRNKKKWNSYQSLWFPRLIKR